MSCGNPHEVDCSEVIEQVYLYLDGEIDDEGRQKVRENHQECRFHYCGRGGTPHGLGGF